MIKAATESSSTALDPTACFSTHTSDTDARLKRPTILHAGESCTESSASLAVVRGLLSEGSRAARKTPLRPYVCQGLLIEAHYARNPFAHGGLQKYYRVFGELLVLSRADLSLRV